MNTLCIYSLWKRYYILLSLFVYKTTSHTCNFNIKLKQTLHNEGFHRNITYEIDYGPYDGDKDWYENCSVGLEQVLPAGLYASPDELKNMIYKTTTVFKSKVDIEVPAELASPITLHLLGSVQYRKSLMSLLVHARYHKPVEGGGYVNVDIPQPHLYINCGAKKLEKCTSKPVVNSFCPRNIQQKCLWIQVPVVGGVPLSWPVPHGNTRHHDMVLLGTAAVVFFGSIYLLKEIHSHKMRYR